MTGIVLLNTVSAFVFSFLIMTAYYQPRFFSKLLYKVLKKFILRIIPKRYQLGNKTPHSCQVLRFGYFLFSGSNLTGITTTFHLDSALI